MRPKWFIPWVILNFLAKIVINIKIYGREKIPKKGRVIIAPNHTSFWDPPLIGLAANREVFYLAKEGLFKVNKFFSWLIRTYNAIPLKREIGGIGAIKKAKELLEKNLCLCIFPEGTRSKTGELLPFKNGVALLSMKTSSPVIPAYIMGAREGFLKWFLRKKKLVIAFGEPLYPDKLNKKNLNEFTEILKKNILKIKEFVEKNEGGFKKWRE
ncbi:MAG: lysophospholipid acyltransferase family protein [candidate division WOR-3 bacterium]